MKRVLTIAAFLLVVGTHFLCSQVQTGVQVGPLGGLSDGLPAIDAPPDIRPFLPSGSTLRAVMATKMAPDGERVFLYDNGEQIFPEVHLRALHDGNEFALFDGNVMAVGGLLPLDLTAARQVLVFAYHLAGDMADTRFAIYSFEDQEYHSIFKRHTTQGRMRVLSTSPLRFEIWSADDTLDKAGESCVWCAHRYTVVTYEFKGDSFDVVAMWTTAKYLDPGQVAQAPFVVVGQRSKPGERTP